MVVETEGYRERSYDYPILINMELSGDKDNLLGMEMNQNYSFKLYQLPLWQYLEFRSLTELEPVENVTLHHSGLGESVKQHTNTPVDLPDLPESEHPEILEYLKRVGLAADSEIWFPNYWPPRVLRAIQFYQEEYSLTRDIAKELLLDIDELTSEEVATIPVIGIFDGEPSSEDGEYQPIRSEELRLEIGGFILEVDEETRNGEYSQVPGSDPRYERSEIETTEGVGAFLLEESTDEAFDSFLESGIDAISELSPTEDEQKANSVLETRRSYGPQRTWHCIDRFYLALIEEIPPHLESAFDESIREIAKLAE